MSEPIQITAQTRVGALLDAYPQLEDVLVEVAPAFAKLKNPILRRTVAKVATLERAAEMAGVPVGVVLKHVRQAVGQEDVAEEIEVPASVEESTPAWVTEATVAETIDADAMLAVGEHPLGILQRRLPTLPAESTICVRSSFKPAPLIDWLSEKGYQVHIVEDGPDAFQTFIRSVPVS